ncbi:hypothetical protein BGLA2_420018 [Burkholderia gladioli]|nr:hypothetical protein BGLA2_420018 [Burkholderia gladioli]
MLAQKVAFLGRHVAVAATLVEIGGNGGTARLVEAIELRIARRGRRHAGTRGLVRRPAPLGALGASEVRCKETGEHDRQCARNPGGSHHCSRFSGRFVPFVTRQPSNLWYLNKPGEYRANELRNIEWVEYPLNFRAK